MRIFKILLACSLLFMCLNTVKAQDYQAIDSLKKLIYNTSSDSIRVNEILELSKLYSFASPGSSLLCIESAMEISMKNDLEYNISKCYGAFGLYYYSISDLDNAQKYWELSYEISKSINYRIGEAQNLSNLGIVFMLKGDNEKALELYNDGLSICRSADLKEKSATIYGNIAIVMNNFGDKDSAMACHKRALEINVEMNNTEGILLNMMNVGGNYNKRGDVNQALNYYKKALEISKNSKNQKMESMLLDRIGTLYRIQGEYVEAISFYQSGLVLNESHGRKQETALSYLEIGMVYYRLEDYPVALEYFEKSLDINTELDYQRGIAWSLNDLGLVYDKLERTEEALVCYFQSLEINRRDGNKSLEAVNLSNIGLVYVRLAAYDKAEDFYQQAVELNQYLGDKHHLSLNYTNIASMYNHKGDYQKVIPYGEKAIILCNEIGANDIKKEVYEYFSECYSELGDYENAYKYRSLWIELKDSVFNTEKTKAIAEIETKYQTEKKEKQILALNLEKETISKEKLQEEQKTRTTIFVTSGILGLIIVLFIIVRLRSKNREVRLQSDFRNLLLEQSNRLNEGKQIERDRIAAELHDGIGSQVNGVYMHLDRLTESEQSAQYKYVLELQKIGTRIRNLSHQLNDTQSANKQHLSQLIEDLCTLHQANNFKVDFQSNNAIENLEFSQLAVIQIYTIIQESLNNTMKHAKATKVTIDMISENDQLSLSIADNGKGMGENQSDGFGLKSIKKRIKSLRGKLEILGADGVFLKIQFPLKTVIESS